MKIVMIGDRGIPARYSGFSTLVEETAVRLVEQHEMDVTVYCRRAYFESRPGMYRGVHLRYLPSPGGKSFESIVHSNLAILDTALRSSDLAFVVDPGNAPFLLPLKLRRIPVVLHTDGLGWMRSKWSPMQQQYYRWSEHVAARLSTALVTDSVAMQRYYQETYGVDSAFIPYGSQVGPPPTDDSLRELKLDRHGYYLVVARLEPENNVDLIIRAYRQSNASRPLVVVGGARYEGPYARSVFALGDNDLVRCVGGIYDAARLNGLYANCYAYLHGHAVGGTNPSLLRAMGAGAACVPIDVVFHREVLGSDGLFFEKSESALAALIDKLEGDEEEIERLRHLGRQRAEVRYNWEAVADGYATLFQRVVDAWHRRQPMNPEILDGVYRVEAAQLQEQGQAVN